MTNKQRNKKRLRRQLYKCSSKTANAQKKACHNFNKGKISEHHSNLQQNYEKDFTCRCFSVADRDAKVFASKDPVPVENKRTHKHPMVFTFNFEFTYQSTTSPFAAVSLDVTKRSSAYFFFEKGEWGGGIA